MTLLKRFKKVSTKKEDETTSKPRKKVLSSFRTLTNKSNAKKSKQSKRKKKKVKKKDKVLTCEDCPIHNTSQNHCIPSDGPNTAKVLFIGEAPGRTEDKKNKVFCGSTGNLLRSFLEDAEFQPGEFRLSNMARCHPGLDAKGKDKKPPVKALSCCKRFLREEIKNMPDLRVIVPLGATALSSITDKSGITAWAGQRIDSNIPEAEGIPVIPNFHPSYISRNENEETFARYMQDFMDLHDEFVREVKSEDKTIETDYTLVDDMDKLDSMISYLKDFEVVAFDVETHGRFPYHEGEQILTFSFSAEPGVAFCVPYEHKDATWSVIHKMKVHRKLKKFLETHNGFIAHNAIFDCVQCKANFGVSVNNIVADTMLLHYCLDETRGTHSLERLAYVYTDMGGYDEELNQIKKEKPSVYDPNKGGSYNNVPIDVLYKYSAGDSDCCLRLYYTLNDEIKESEYGKELAKIATGLMTKATKGLTYTQNNGAHVDKETLQFLDSFYTKKMNSLVKQMAELPEVVEFITDKKRELRAERRAEEAAKKKKRKKYRPRKKKKKEDEFEFNPGSPDQVRTLFFGYLGLPKVKKTDAGKLSTDEEVLEELSGQHELVDLIREHRANSKLHGTYIKSIIKPKGKRPALMCRDGCLRSSYLLHGTTTGRLASREPNLQNIPRAGEIKKMFVSRFGEDGLIMEADYSQIELRIAAMLSQDEIMMSVYEEDGDIHMETACSLFHATAEELEGDKEKRSVAKRVNFGIIYGTGARGLMDQLKKEGIIITKNQARDYINKFYEKYLGIGRWVEEQEQFTTKNLIAISPFGRIRHLPQAGSPDNYLRSDALRAAVNHPVQSAASDCTLMSLSKLSEVLQQEKWKSKIILTVHDSIIFDVHKSELDRLAPLVLNTMESVSEWAPEYIGVDTSWMCLPAKVDIEVGDNWKELESYSFDV